MRRTLLGFIALTLMLAGCATYMKAMYGEGEASADFQHCVGKAGLFDPTRSKLNGCMRDAGWEKIPDTPDGPSSYRRL